MQTIGPGIVISEGRGDEPRRCSEIGCPCVIPKPLVDVRQGSTLVFFCPSSKISASLTTESRGMLIMGGHYTGAVR